jgi:hypothetical protein
MFGQQVEQAIDAARGGRALDDISKIIWCGFSEGVIGDDEAQRLAERLHTRRALYSATAAAGASCGPSAGAASRPSIFGPPRRPQRPPVRSQAIERRRRIAVSGFAPPAIAARFTTAEQAALAIIADEVRHRGDCRLPIDAIAAKAGCSRSSVKNAIRSATRIGLIRVTARPRRGQKNLPNVIEIVATDWQTWLKRGPRRPAGDRGQKPDPHGYKDNKLSRNNVVEDKRQGIAQGSNSLHKST